MSCPWPRQRQHDGAEGCETWIRPSTGSGIVSATGFPATGPAKARASGALASLAYERFHDGRAAGAAEDVLLGHLNAALRGYLDALDLIPAEHRDCAAIHNQIGSIYGEVGDTWQALHHYQQSLNHEETRGDVYGAGMTRGNIDPPRSRLPALATRCTTLAPPSRTSRPSARSSQDATEARRLITRLELRAHPNPGPTPGDPGAGY